MRRQEIMEALEASNRPVSGAELAQRFGVSRQVIVQDVALLRATGTPIAATPRGYVLAQPNQPRDVVMVRHGKDRTEEELTCLVDLGLTVVDVMIDHPVYGELRGDLGLSCRADVASFLKKVSSGAELLSSLTSGVHYHTLEGREEALAEGVRTLERRGFLFSGD